ncbi:hypothetical protein [Capnocytophaga canis]|uniref:Uncharacterized protein n=1 Tax=Capnocytophaga canis TaxID=1848903 RepID=A0A0B7IRJ2_9FLAO|nr:hypothetical protein [Capnocytophaga canis]CEN54450.1 hypothetical protein CCAND93_90034 [Capnocytophaga canis]
MEDFYKRLKEVFDFQNIDNPTKLQKKYGFNNTTATNYMEKGRIPKTEYLLTIKQKFEELDLNWLFTGKGEMLVNKSIESLTSDEKIKFLEEKMLLMEENSNLLKENSELKIANLKLQNEIANLKKVQSDNADKQTA